MNAQRLVFIVIVRIVPGPRWKHAQADVLREAYGGKSGAARIEKPDNVTVRYAARSRISRMHPSYFAPTMLGPQAVPTKVGLVARAYLTTYDLKIIASRSISLGL